MLKGIAFEVFLSLLLIPLSFFHFYFFVLFSVVFAFVVFNKRWLRAIAIPLTLVLISTVIHLHILNKKRGLEGYVLNLKGVVLGQKNTRYTSTYTVLSPFVKDNKGKIILPFGVYVVKAPLSFKDHRGDFVSVRGILKREKVYKNRFFSNWDYLVSTNKLFFLKVKQREFIEFEKGIGILNPDKMLFKHYSDFRVMAFLKSLFLGRRDCLEKGLRERTKRLGIYHLFVFSGFHFGIFALVILSILFPLPLRKRWKRAITLLFLTIFLFITSFSPPSLRVYLMLFVYFVFDFADIKIEPLEAIGIAGVLMLIINPFNALNVGFLMSFFASAGIVITAKRSGFFLSFITIPFVAFFILTPFYLEVFNYIPVFSPFVNIILLPFVVILFWLFVINLLFNGIITGLITLYTLKLLSLIEGIKVISFDVYPSIFLTLASFSTLILFFYLKRPKVLLINIVLILVALTVKPFSGDFMCFLDSRRPYSSIVNSQNRCIVINTGDFYFASQILKKELGFRGVKEIGFVFSSPPNSRDLDKLEVVCNNVSVRTIVINRNWITPFVYYRLKWIEGFFKVKVVYVENGESVNTGSVKLSFLPEGVSVSVFDKKVCFSKRKQFEKCNFFFNTSSGELIYFQSGEQRRISLDNGEYCIERGENPP